MLEYHVWCNPYMAFLNLQTWCSFLGISKPFGYTMNISFKWFLFKNAKWTSSCLINQLCWKAKATMVYMVAHLIVKAKVFWKSILTICSKPRTTNLAFNFCTKPYVVGFVLYKVKAHYKEVTMYYFLGVPCLNFNHVIICRIFTMFLHIMVSQNPNKSNSKKITFFN
jgi:hypothetical protein